MFMSLSQMRNDAMKIIKDNSIDCPAEIYFAVVNASGGDVIQARINLVVNSICRELGINAEMGN